jgi:DNA-binding HxlR family transcriptional regulator
LSITLKQLEEDNIIKREVFATKPPLKVEYSLTEFGKTLIPVLDAVAKWGRELSHEKGEIIEV